jgi:hypothetical protein
MTNNSNDDCIRTNQQGVPDLIQKLHNAQIEEVQNSDGTVHQYVRDPHLRLRRTLTPSLHTGMSKYNESQFCIHPTTGQRRTIQFTALGHDFFMDVYSWGASEDAATIRIFGLHGISPAVSRTQWHPLGEQIQQDPTLSKTVRFVAIDWHSIDRTDKYQTEFLTLLPKHIFDPVPKDQQEEFVKLYLTDKDKAGITKLMNDSRLNCPRRFTDAVAVLNSVIMQGLEWGADKGKPFIPCVKSWSGGVLMELLHESVTTKQQEYRAFRQSILGAVILHPGCYLKSTDEVQLSLDGLDVLMAWAKDDDLVPYPSYSVRYTHNNDRVRLVAYETGRHGSFNGSDPNDPNFNHEILRWLKEKCIVDH